MWKKRDNFWIVKERLIFFDDEKGLLTYLQIWQCVQVLESIWISCASTSVSSWERAFQESWPHRGTDYQNLVFSHSVLCARALFEGRPNASEIRITSFLICPRDRFISNLDRNTNVLGATRQPADLRKGRGG